MDKTKESITITDSDLGKRRMIWIETGESTILIQLYKDITIYAIVKKGRKVKLETEILGDK